MYTEVKTTAGDSQANYLKHLDKRNEFKNMAVKVRNSDFNYLYEYT